MWYSAIKPVPRQLTESYMKEEDKQVAEDYADLSNVKNKYHFLIWDMLRNHKAMWNGRLDNIEVAKHATDPTKSETVQIGFLLIIVEYPSTQSVGS